MKSLETTLAAFGILCAATTATKADISLGQLDSVARGCVQEVLDATPTDGLRRMTKMAGEVRGSTHFELTETFNSGASNMLHVTLMPMQIASAPDRESIVVMAKKTGADGRWTMRSDAFSVFAEKTVGLGDTKIYGTSSVSEQAWLQKQTRNLGRDVRECVLDRAFPSSWAVRYQ